MAEDTTAEKAPAKKAEKTEAEAPVEEGTPAVLAGSAGYKEGQGNWSDPPELAEGEVEAEGSAAKPLQEDLDEENEKIEKDEKERIAKAQEANAKAAEARAKEEAKKT